MLRFFYGGGTTNEVFKEYFAHLVTRMTEKYPEKKLVFVMDNLKSHKSSLVVRIVDHFPHVHILFTAA